MFFFGNCERQPGRHNHSSQSVIGEVFVKINVIIPLTNTVYHNISWSSYFGWYIAACNFMVFIQNTVNKKIIQNVDIEICFHNFISQNVIDDLCKNSLR